MKPNKRPIKCSTPLLTLGALLPFFYLLLLSISHDWFFPDLLPRRLHFELWLKLIQGKMKLGSSFLLSTFISSLVAALATCFGFLTGKYLHHRSNSLFFLAYAPYVLSPVIMGVCLIHLYLKLGLMGNIKGVILAQLSFAFAYSLILFRSFWNANILAMEELVYTLGGNVWQAYRTVLIPMAKPLLLLCYFQTFLLSWFQYGLTLLIGAGKVQTLPLKVYDYIFEANVYYAALASCLLVLPPIFLLWANKKYLLKRI